MSMMLDEVGTIGIGAAHIAAEYITETLCKNVKNPTESEAEAVSSAIIITIAALEANLKANLPENVRHNTRAALESLSATLGTQIQKMRTARNEVSEATNREGAGKITEGEGRGQAGRTDSKLILP